MKPKLVIILFLLIIVNGCAKKTENIYTGNYTPALDKGSLMQPTKYVPVPVAGQLMPLKYKKSHHLTGEAAIRSANNKAKREPNSGEYINSIMTFDYMPGALYQIYCAPLSVSDIQFQSNEHIVAVGAGDTLRWQVSKTYSGAGGLRQEHLLVKPVDDGLVNSLVVTTDQRTYHLMLHSTPKTYMASVTWRYPDADGLIQNFSEDQVDMDTTDISKTVDLDRMNFNYQIQQVKGKKLPEWYPRMVFTDGSKTYIKFPSGIQDTPTLFVGNDVKNDQIINYRVAGNYYIVDSVISQAQLRGGQGECAVVQISYRMKN